MRLDRMKSISFGVNPAYAESTENVPDRVTVSNATLHGSVTVPLRGSTPPAEESESGKRRTPSQVSLAGSKAASQRPAPTDEMSRRSSSPDKRRRSEEGGRSSGESEYADVVASTAAVASAADAEQAGTSVEPMQAPAHEPTQSSPAVGPAAGMTSPPKTLAPVPSEATDEAAVVRGAKEDRAKPTQSSPAAGVASPPKTLGPVSAGATDEAEVATGAASGPVPVEPATPSSLDFPAPKLKKPIRDEAKTASPLLSASEHFDGATLKDASPTKQTSGQTTSKATLSSTADSAVEAVPQRPSEEEGGKDGPKSPITSAEVAAKATESEGLSGHAAGAKEQDDGVSPTGAKPK